MRTVITLPLSEAERATIPPFLAEYEKACDAALAEYEKACDAAWSEYGKVRDAALAEYGKVRDAAWSEYEKVRDAALAEYEKVRAAALAEYEKVRAAALAEYEKVRDAALAERDKVCDAPPLVGWIVGTFLHDRKEEARAVLEALADGATMADLYILAEERGWCDTWDNALIAASELFDIR